MAELFENYERRIDKINGVLKQYGIKDIQECKDICDKAGIDVAGMVRGIQTICFDDA